MPNMRFGAALLAALLSFAAMPALAQNLVLGLGHADFSRPVSEDTEVISFEYQHTPFHDTGRLRFGVAAALDVHAAGDYFLGLGIYGEYDLSRRWFAEASLMPGVYQANEARNDLGRPLEFRSLLGVGYRLDERHSISLAVTHKSNASTGRINPGVDSVLLRLHRRY